MSILRAPLSGAAAVPLLAGLLLFVAIFPAQAEEPARTSDTRPDILKALDGRWIMSGDVMGRPATYDMVAGAGLAGGVLAIQKL